MKTQKKKELKEKMDLIKRSSPRPEIRLRSTTFEDKSKYKRSRVRSEFRKEMRIHE